MDWKIFKSLAQNARRVEWSEEAVFNGRRVVVQDVDLKATASLDAPMSATVAFVDGSAPRVIEGVFWPRDVRPESVEIDGVQQENGKVGISGKYSFPASVKVKLRFRYGSEGEFLMTGKAGVGVFF